MGDFLELFKNWALVGLVVVSIFSFAIAFQSENDAPEQFIDEDDMMSRTFINLQTNLGNESVLAQSQKSLFESENPTSGFGSLLLFSIVSIGKVFNGMVMGTYNILIKLPATYLGVNPIVFSVIGAILIISIILYLWKSYKLGG